MKTPYITIDLDKIEHNARAVVRLCRQHGISVTGVTKATCGQPEIAKAMLRGGVQSLADSRLINIHRLQSAGIQTQYMLLRVPALSEVNDVIASVDISLNSELQTLQALSAAAVQAGKVHEVIVMVDLGDLREGILPSEVLSFVGDALKLPGIRIIGLGTNLACFAGVVPSENKMNHLLELTQTVKQTFQLPLKIVSGINSSGLELIAENKMPPGINHARMGEAILLGRETVHRKPWPGTRQDAFVLHAEVIELNDKPSMPIGERSQNAFGDTPSFKEQGLLKRVLLNIGREDIDLRGLLPMDQNIKIIGASSGYLAMDVSHVESPVQLGDVINFTLSYGALLAAMTSEYVYKCYVEP
jgi:predicted amino acid racemase